ncbi:MULTISPECIES: carbohydrate ABC transporter permease [Actinomadura]|uniref:carbohydrate ABC transporter permease n=1 Tax=Actinomadura TaxID=1988 RepID=UPI0003ACFEB2|nr:carbohydrate ABC transporter permease [Actinomadura madurae]
MHGYTRWTAFREAGLWIAAVPVLAPVYFVVATAFKTPGEAAGSSFAPPSSPTTANLAQAWEQAGGGTVSFGQALFNSVLTTAVVVLLLVLTAAPAGYALARRTSRLSGLLSGLFILAMIMPIQLGVIPLYVFLVDTGLAGTRAGLILVYLGLQTPLAVFLYAGFIRGLPAAYEEAARVDGASSLLILVRIVFPLVRPATGVVAALTGLFVWNDFFVALVVVGGTDRVTLPVAVYSLVGRFSADWPLIFASTLIALAPVLAGYAFAQRAVMKGYVSTLRG